MYFKAYTYGFITCYNHFQYIFVFLDTKKSYATKTQNLQLEMITLYTLCFQVLL